MNKLIAISVLLLSLNLYGADKKSRDQREQLDTLLKLNEIHKHGQRIEAISITGLEGWGKERGVWVTVEDYSNIYNDFNVKAIKNQVEQRLRQALIKVSDKVSFDNLYIDMQPDIITADSGKVITTRYAIDIRTKRFMSFKYNGKEYICLSANGKGYGGISSSNYRPTLEKILDRLLLDYLKANPKKEKK